MLISWRMGFGVFGFFGTVSKNVLLSWSWLLVSRIQKHVKFHVQLHMHVHVHILAYACTCTHTHRQQYEQYHTDSLDRRTKQKGQKPKEAVKSLTTHSRIAPAARLEGVDSGGGGTIYATPPSRIRALTVCTLLRAIRMLFQPEPPNPKRAPTPKARDSIRHGIT